MVKLEHVYMRSEVNSDQFEISLRGKFLFGEFDRSKSSNRSKFFMSTVNARSEIKLRSLVNK